jgi:DNA polymerase-3 subunit delta
VTFEAILQELKQKKFRPIYFLCGEEPYFIDTISDYIENTVLAEEERDFNQTILYGQDTDTANILANAKRFPMMSEKQVVIIKEAQNVKDLISKDDERAAFLLNYIQNPQPTTVLVFCYKNKTLDKLNKTSEIIKEKIKK